MYNPSVFRVVSRERVKGYERDRKTVPDRPDSARTPFTIAPDGGSVLLTTLALCLCAAIICATLDSLSIFSSRTVAAYTSSRQVYWIARSQALTALKGIRAGTVQAGVTRFRVGVADVKQEVTAVTVPQPVWQVIVTARTPQAQDVVLTTYNAAHSSVTAWQDNGQDQA